MVFVAKIIPGLAIPEKDPSIEAEVSDPSYIVKISALLWVSKDVKSYCKAVPVLLSGQIVRV